MIFNWKKKSKEKTEKTQKTETSLNQENTRYGSVNKNMSNPYIISIENISAEEKNWVIFGSNVNLLALNHGNDLEVKVENKATQTPYSAILVEMISQRIKVGLIRFQSNDKKNIQEDNFIIVEQTNTSGTFQNSVKSSEVPLCIMMDAYQQQGNILDIRVSFDIDKYTHLTGKISPKSKIIISLFPIEKENETYDYQRLTGLNVAPVIFQTSIKTTPKTSFWAYWSKLKNVFKKTQKTKS